MGLIKEPLNIDFTIDPRPLTEEEQKAISNYIQAEKAKNKVKVNKRSTKLNKTFMAGGLEG